MQNKPNFLDALMNVSSIITREYENKTLGGSGKNKANTNPNKANLLDAQMNVNKVLTRDYEKISNWAICENKPNTNPIKANFTYPQRPATAGKELPAENQLPDGSRFSMLGSRLFHALDKKRIF